MKINLQVILLLDNINALKDNVFQTEVLGGNLKSYKNLLLMESLVNLENS